MRTDHTAQKIFASASALISGPLADRSRTGVVVLTKGVFDLLHVGHIESFEVARSLGDVLVVGVNTDDAVRARKGTSRPILDLNARIRMVAALEYVSWVIPYHDESPYELLRTIRPSIFVASHFESLSASERRELSASVAFHRVEKCSGVSTSRIIKAIQTGKHITAPRIPALDDAGHIQNYRSDE